MKKKNTSEFIKEAKEIHEDRYDYSKVAYRRNNDKVKIICLKHGEFEQAPLKHINGKQGCPQCGNESTHDKQRMTIVEFIEEAKKVHGGKYDYSLTKYINYKNDVDIICPTHGKFNQSPSNHLHGKGCKYCGGTTKLDTNLFIFNAKKIHGDKYNYSNVKFIDSRTPIKIICPEHGAFEQLPNNHTSKKQGCYECLGKVFDNRTFIKKANEIHYNKYDYSKIVYVNSITPITIICSEHGEFEQSPNSHLNGSTCPMCSIKDTTENKLKDFITSLSVDITGNTRKIIHPLELDIYIPNHNIAIEYNGLYWHSEEHKDKNYHINKTLECEKQSIKLIHIFEDEWIHKEEIVKSRLMNLLGLTPNKIYGRKCIIKEVFSKGSKEFLNSNHIQGNVNSKIRFGLYHNEELVSLMTFGKLRKNMGKVNLDGSYELLRFCNKLDTTVIGGADKLLKHFIKTYNPKELISYADRRWSQGNLYEKLGFKFSHDSKPNYYYIFNTKRKYRFNFRKDILIKEGYDPLKSEHEIMLERGIYRIYDCGNKCYKMSFKR